MKPAATLLLSLQRVMYKNQCINTGSIFSTPRLSEGNQESYYQDYNHKCLRKAQKQVIFGIRLKSLHYSKFQLPTACGLNNLTYSTILCSNLISNAIFTASPASIKFVHRVTLIYFYDQNIFQTIVSLKFTVRYEILVIQNRKNFLTFKKIYLTITIHKEQGFPRNRLCCCWRLTTGTPILFFFR